MAEQETINFIHISDSFEDFMTFCADYWDFGGFCHVDFFSKCLNLRTLRLNMLKTTITTKAILFLNPFPREKRLEKRMVIVVSMAFL